MDFQIKPIEVIIQAPAPRSWVWRDSLRNYNTGEFCPPHPDDSLMLSMQLRDLGSFQKSSESFMLNLNNKLKTIKIIRALNGMGLKEAKDLVERMLEEQAKGVFSYKFDCCL